MLMFVEMQCYITDPGGLSIYIDILMKWTALIMYIYV